MSLIRIDAEKCKRDGICTQECPFALLFMKDAESVPEPAGHAEALCIRCGHCVAVCPAGAISLKGMAQSDCPPIRKELAVGPEQAEQFLRSRRSIRVYKDRQAPLETLQKLVEIARSAPTAHNDQEVHWIVIDKKEEAKKLAQMTVDWMRSIMENDPERARKMHLDMVVGAWDFGLDVISRDAPHLVLVHAEEGTPFSKYYPADCATALAYLELAAPSFGLGSCWNGMLLGAALEDEKMQKALNLPENHQCMGALMLGYPKFKYHRLVLRNPPPIKWGLDV